MRLLLIAMLALQPATLIYMLQEDSGITLGVQIGNVIYSAEFPPQAVKPGSIHEGEQVRAEVKDGMLIVRLKNGKKMTDRVIRIQRILSHPLPD